MECFADCQKRLVALQHRAKAQADALKILENALAQEVAHLHRLSQARSLDALRARVTDDVEEIQQLEAAASYKFTTTKMFSGLEKFAVGSLRAVLRGTQQHPLLVGAKLAADEFTRTRPFCTVMMAVGANGVPDEVNAIPVSQWARDLVKSESEIVAALKARGYLLMVPQAFFEALDELKDRVLRGISILPVTRASFLTKLVDGGSE